MLVERHPAEEVVEEKNLLFRVVERGEAVIEAADRDQFPAFSKIGVGKHFGERRLADAAGPGNDQYVLVFELGG